VVSCALTQKEILEDWSWIEKNLLATLSTFDDEDQVTEFVCCKVQSLVAYNRPSENPVAEGTKIKYCAL